MGEIEASSREERDDRDTEDLALSRRRVLFRTSSLSIAIMFMAAPAQAQFLDGLGHALGEAIGGAIRGGFSKSKNTRNNRSDGDRKSTRTAKKKTIKKKDTEEAQAKAPEPSQKSETTSPKTEAPPPRYDTPPSTGSVEPPIASAPKPDAKPKLPGPESLE
jgi:hypothetical protein